MNLKNQIINILLEDSDNILLLSESEISHPASAKKEIDAQVNQYKEDKKEINDDLNKIGELAPSFKEKNPEAYAMMLK